MDDMLEQIIKFHDMIKGVDCTVHHRPTEILQEHLGYFDSLNSFPKGQKQLDLLGEIYVESRSVLDDLLLEGGELFGKEIKPNKEIRHNWNSLKHLDSNSTDLVMKLERQSERQKILQKQLEILFYLTGEEVIAKYHLGKFDSPLKSGGSNTKDVLSRSKIMLVDYILDESKDEEQKDESKNKPKFHDIGHEVDEFIALYKRKDDDIEPSLYRVSDLFLSRQALSPKEHRMSYIGFKRGDNDALNDKILKFFTTTQGRLMSSVTDEFSYKYLQFLAHFSDVSMEEAPAFFLSQYLGPRKYGVMPIDLGGSTQIKKVLADLFGLTHQPFYQRMGEAFIGNGREEDILVEEKKDGDQYLLLVDIHPKQVHKSLEFDAVNSFSRNKKTLWQLASENVEMAYEQLIERTEVDIGRIGEFHDRLLEANTHEYSKLSVELWELIKDIPKVDFTLYEESQHTGKETFARFPVLKGLKDNLINTDADDLIDDLENIVDGHGDINTTITESNYAKIANELEFLQRNMYMIMYVHDEGTKRNVTDLEKALDLIDSNPSEAINLINSVYSGEEFVDYKGRELKWRRLFESQKIERFPKIWSGENVIPFTHIDSFTKPWGLDDDKYKPMRNERKYPTLDVINKVNVKDLRHIVAIKRDVRSLIEDLTLEDSTKSYITRNLPPVNLKAAVTQGQAVFTVKNSSTGSPVDKAYRILDAGMLKKFYSYAQSLIALWNKDTKAALIKDKKALVHFSHAIPSVIVPFTRQYLEDEFGVDRLPQSKVEFLDHDTKKVKLENVKDIAGNPITEVVSISHKAHNYLFNRLDDIVGGWFTRKSSAYVGEDEEFSKGVHRIDKKMENNYPMDKMPFSKFIKGEYFSHSLNVNTANFYDYIESKFDSLSRDFKQNVIKDISFVRAFPELSNALLSVFMNKDNYTEDEEIDKQKIIDGAIEKLKQIEQIGAADFFDAYQFDIARGALTQYNCVGAVMFSQSLISYVGAMNEQVSIGINDSELNENKVQTRNSMNDDISEMIQDMDVVAHGLRVLHWTRHFNEFEQVYKALPNQRRTATRVNKSKSMRLRLMKWYFDKAISDDYAKKDSLINLVESIDNTPASFSSQVLHLTEEVFEKRLDQPWKFGEAQNYDSIMQNGILDKLGVDGKYSVSLVLGMHAMVNPLTETDSKYVSVNKEGKFNFNHEQINALALENISRENKKYWINGIQMLETIGFCPFDGVKLDGVDAKIVDASLFEKSLDNYNGTKEFVVKNDTI